MSGQSRFATLLLATALLSAPCLSSAAYAHNHDGTDQAPPYAWHEHGHFSEAQIKLLHETMHRMHEANRPLHEELERLHEARHNILTAETFDAKAFLEISARIESERAQLEKSHAQAFASIADQFSPEQRKHVARLFSHHHHGDEHQDGMRHGGWHHEDGHDGWHHHEHHADYEEGRNSGELPPATVGQPPHDDGYPPYAPK